MPEFISGGDLVAQIRKKFGSRGNSNLTLDSNIAPSVNLQDLDAPPFHSKGGVLCGFGQPAVAAQLSYVALLLDLLIAPPAARTVVKRFFVSAGGTPIVVLYGMINIPAFVASGVLPALSQTRPIGSWDSVPANLTTDVVRNASTLANGTSATQVNLNSPGILVVPANTTVTVEGPFCIAPGNALSVNTAAVNVSMNVAFYGDEYLVG